MDGGVTVPMQPPPGHQQPGFFHMPNLHVPAYQKPRVHAPFNVNKPPPGSGPGGGRPDQRSAPQSRGGDSSDTAAQGVLFDGKRMRKPVHRKTVDYNSSVIKYLENRIWQRDFRDAHAIQPDNLYQIDIRPPCDMLDDPMNILTTKFMRQSTNKFRCPIFCLAWTPEGRRLVTGASSGEFTLWNGLTFNFETILQAHDTSVRAMVWSHNDQWMVTGDHSGFIKYWQTNMNNVKMYQGHKEPIRGIRWGSRETTVSVDSLREYGRSKVTLSTPTVAVCLVPPDWAGVSVQGLWLYILTYINFKCSHNHSFYHLGTQYYNTDWRKYLYLLKYKLRLWYYLLYLSFIAIAILLAPCRALAVCRSSRRQILHFANEKRYFIMSFGIQLKFVNYNYDLLVLEEQDYFTEKFKCFRSKKFFCFFLSK